MHLRSTSSFLLRKSVFDKYIKTKIKPIIFVCYIFCANRWDAKEFMFFWPIICKFCVKGKGLNDFFISSQPCQAIYLKCNPFKFKLNKNLSKNIGSFASQWKIYQSFYSVTRFENKIFKRTFVRLFHESIYFCSIICSISLYLWAFL